MKRVIVAVVIAVLVVGLVGDCFARGKGKHKKVKPVVEDVIGG